jgi:5-formyltetrahydrofolate cyclo-ligase
MNEPDVRRALREMMRSRREALPPTVRLAAAEALARQLHTLPGFGGAQRLAGYWAVRGELPLHALLAPPLSFEYHLPVLQADRSLRFAAWRAGAPLGANRYGIPEPAVDAAALRAGTELDLVLLPLLAFDRHGGRLGSGAGYYDRSFAFLRTQPRPARPLLVGVGYGFQEVARLPLAEWDVPLDYVATEAEVIRCASSGQ